MEGVCVDCQVLNPLLSAASPLPTLPRGLRVRRSPLSAFCYVSSLWILPAPIACLFHHMANIVTRRGLCLGKATVQPARAQGQRPAVHLSTQVLPGLVMSSLQETELQARRWLLVRALIDSLVLKALVSLV